MASDALDMNKYEQFGDQMVNVVNSAGIALMTSLGHQSGLFDTMAELPPANSHQIAEKTQLNERYVREWLAAMVAGRIVDYDSQKEEYFLPPEHAAWLTRAAGINNFARETVLVAILGGVEQDVLNSFRNGGGVPYSQFVRFHDWMAQTSRAIAEASLIDALSTLVPDTYRRLRHGISVADVGCGQGDSIRLLAKAFPKSQFFGYDISQEAIAAGQDLVHEDELDNVSLHVRDAAKLGIIDQFDLVIAFDTIHDLPQPQQVLQEISRALRAQGTFLMVEFAASSDLEDNLDHPFGPWLYAASCMHCLTVSLAYGGPGLGTMWGTQNALELLTEAGFKDVVVKQVEADFFNQYFIAST